MPAVHPSPCRLQVHHIDSAVVMLVDILAPGPVPISSPLPLAVPLAAVEHGLGLEHQQLPERPARGSCCGDQAVPDPAAAAARSPTQAGGAPPSELVLAGDGQQLAGAAVAAAASALQLHYPSWLVDGAAGVVYRLQLDLAAIADCQSDYTRLLAFLQRRRPAAAPRRDAAGITLRVLRVIMQDEAPLGLLRSAFDVVNLFAEDKVAASQQHSGTPGLGTPQRRQAPAGVRSASPSPSPAATSHQQNHQPRPIVTPQASHPASSCLVTGQLSSQSCAAGSR